MFNRATIIGRLGKDPESRTGPTGQLKVTFTVATDENYKDRDGVKQERTEWHNIVAWGKLGEIIMKHLHKGDQALIEGPIRTDVWEDKKDATKRHKTYILANNVRFMGGPKRHGEESHV
jgi:single-strand DNA-binding protein